VGFLAETTLPIDWERERRRGGGPATDFLRKEAGRQFSISAITCGEFLEGVPPERRAEGNRILARFPQLPVTGEIADAWASGRRRLRESGTPIGSNDLWIAATAIVHGLVTRNRRDFERVSGLSIAAY
jgi:tRNA(fMet)-specific endonuclease VapC